MPITKICVFLTICLLSGACAMQTVQPPPDDPSSLYQEALLQQNRGDPEGAYKKLIHIWQSYPQNSIAPQALFSAASIAETTNPPKAIALYKTLYKQYPQSDSAFKAQERLFMNHLSNKRHTEAINLFKSIYSTTTDPAWRLHGVKLVHCLAEANRISEAFDIIEEVYPSTDDRAREQRLSLWDFVVDKIEQLEILSQLKTKVNDPDLLEILDAREELLAEEQAYTQGREPFRPLPYPSLASEDELYPVNRIGVIVPLSGKWETVGEKILKGVQFASKVFSEEQTPQVEYLIRDYASDDTKLPAIIAELESQYNVLAIIGPVGEQAGEITCSIAQEKGVPAFIFTQAERLPVYDSFCFNNFISINIQVETLLQVASEMNIATFAILTPSDNFGQIFSSLFEQMAPDYGIEIIREVRYDPQKVDFKQEVKSLLVEKVPFEKEEGLQENPLEEEVPEEEILVADFEALLIPDSAINSAMIASYLAYYNAENVRLFGPSLWDNPDFLKIGGRYVDNAVFTSGFFFGSRLNHVQDFNNSFYYLFGYNPSIWEASAYDTASILQNLLYAEIHTRNSLLERLTSLRDYPGVTGSTSFYPDGTVEKVIFTVSVKGSNVFEISP